MSIDLLPAYVNDWFWCYGFTDTERRLTIQQRGADSADAFNYYSALISAMQAIGAQTPVVPAFGDPPTKLYAYGLATLPPLSTRGGILAVRSGRDPATKRCWGNGMTKHKIRTGRQHRNHDQNSGDYKQAAKWAEEMKRRREQREMRRKHAEQAPTEREQRAQHYD